MSKKQTVILMVLVFLVLILLIGMKFVFNSGDKDFNDNEIIEKDINNEPEEELETSEFTKEINEDIEETEPEITIGVKGSDDGEVERLGGYTIIASEDGFTPNTLAVKLGTIVSLKFKAEGNKYDFSIPKLSIYLSVDDGETKDASFYIPNVGTYRFECRDFCPSSGKVLGQLVVKPKE